MIEDDESEEFPPSPSEITPETAPPFADTDEDKIRAIVEIFFREADEDLYDWINNDWPRFNRPTTIVEAIAKAERTGDASELRTIIEEASRKKARGRPKMHPAVRVEAFPIHRAASMVETVELTLSSWYPGRLIRDLRPLACRVVEDIWREYFRVELNEAKPSGNKDPKLLTFVGRSRKSRQRRLA
jgi:hypothetical protein